jgi:hypothetical protein
MMQRCGTREDNQQPANMLSDRPVMLKGLVSAKHLNGEIGQVTSERDMRGRSRVRLYKTNEIVGVKDENMVQVGDENRLKRMAYAFVKQDFYKIPRSERRPPTQAELSQRVAARYQSILEEYCTTGDVDCLGYDYFDAPDSPVPIFGAEFDILVREMAESASNEGVRDGAPISEGDSDQSRSSQQVCLGLKTS